MTPAQLAKSNSEHGHQRAFFAWLNMAERAGFAAAWDDAAYKVGYPIDETLAVPELKWAHAIPNGGLREKRTAAMLKAEGVKRGIPDTFLPLPLWGDVLRATCDHPAVRAIQYAGLYVEFKRPEAEGQRAGTTSAEQDECISWLRHSGYAVSVVFTWDQAAREVQSYVEAVRRGEQQRRG